MAHFSKTVLRLGTFQPKEGEFEATPERMQHWEDTFREMKEAGLLVPICWGHQPEGEPTNDQQLANKEYKKAQFNAGYLSDLRFDPSSGELEMEGEVPGAELDENGNLVTKVELPDGTKMITAIKEVSASFRDWDDGQGRNWPDAMVHVALTPWPVVDGQEQGFEPKGGPKTLGIDRGFCLSLRPSLVQLADEPSESEGPSFHVVHTRFGTSSEASSHKKVSSHQTLEEAQSALKKYKRSLSESQRRAVWIRGADGREVQTSLSSDTFASSLSDGELSLGEFMLASGVSPDSDHATKRRALDDAARSGTISMDYWRRMHEQLKGEIQEQRTNPRKNGAQMSDPVNDDGRGEGRIGNYRIRFHKERKAAYSGKIIPAGYQATDGESGRSGFTTREEAEKHAREISSDEWAKAKRGGRTLEEHNTSGGQLSRRKEQEGSGDQASLSDPIQKEFVDQLESRSYSWEVWDTDGYVGDVDASTEDEAKAAVESQFGEHLDAGYRVTPKKGEEVDMAISSGKNYPLDMTPSEVHRQARDGHYQKAYEETMRAGGDTSSIPAAADHAGRKAAERHEYRQLQDSMRRGYDENTAGEASLADGGSKKFSGVSFEHVGEGHWKSTPDDDWEHSYASVEGKVIGKRMIDGKMHEVVQTPEGKHHAILPGHFGQQASLARRSGRYVQEGPKLALNSEHPEYVKAKDRADEMSRKAVTPQEHQAAADAHGYASRVINHVAWMKSQGTGRKPTEADYHDEMIQHHNTEAKKGGQASLAQQQFKPGQRVIHRDPLGEQITGEVVGHEGENVRIRRNDSGTEQTARQHMVAPLQQGDMPHERRTLKQDLERVGRKPNPADMANEGESPMNFQVGDSIQTSSGRKAKIKEVGEDGSLVVKWADGSESKIGQEQLDSVQHLPSEASLAAREMASQPASSRMNMAKGDVKPLESPEAHEREAGHAQRASEIQGKTWPSKDWLRGEAGKHREAAEKVYRQGEPEMNLASVHEQPGKHYVTGDDEPLAGPFDSEEEATKWLNEEYMAPSPGPGKIEIKQDGRPVTPGREASLADEPYRPSKRELRETSGKDQMDAFRSAVDRTIGESVEKRRAKEQFDERKARGDVSDKVVGGHHTGTMAGQPSKMSIKPLALSLAGDPFGGEPGEPDQEPPLAPTMPIQTPDEVAKASLGRYEDISDCLLELAELGVVLPEDTTKENFWERFKSALKTARFHVEKAKTETAHQQDQMPGGGGDAGQEEPRPILMGLTVNRSRLPSKNGGRKMAALLSLQTASSPTERMLLRNEEQRQRTEMGRRINKLEKRGLNKVEADRLRKMAGTYNLSLTSDGSPIKNQVAVELSLLERVMPKRQFSDDYLSDNAQEQPRPGGEEDMKKFAQERAAKMSRAGSK